jgi:WD40 repeat protein
MTATSDSRLVATGWRSGTIELHDLREKRSVWREEAPKPIGCGAIFRGGGAALAVEGSNTSDVIDAGGDIMMLSPQGRRRLSSPHRGHLTGVTTLDQTHALTVDKKGIAVVWSEDGSAALRASSPTAFTACAVWHATGTGIVGTCDERVIILDEVEQELSLYSTDFDVRSGISALAAAGTSLHVLATYFNGLVRFHGPDHGWIGRDDMRHSLRGTAVALEPSCQFAASGNLNGEVQIWRCRDGQRLFDAPLHEGSVTALCFCAPNLLLSAGADGIVFVIDVNAARVVDGVELSGTIVALQPELTSVLALMGIGDVFALQVASSAETLGPFKQRA